MQSHLSIDGFSMLMSALGVLGAAGVALVPFRAWNLAVRRRIGEPPSLRPAHLAFAALPAVALLFAVYVGVDALPKVYRCLLDSSRCSANRAGGMINLATFGFAVAVLEVAWLL